MSGIVKGKTTCAFRSCENKGIHLTFPNGWTVSIQFGAGNYCDNYDLLLEGDRIKLWTEKPDLESSTAEVWCWNDKKHYPEEPLSHQSITDVLRLLNKISKRRGGGEE